MASMADLKEWAVGAMKRARELKAQGKEALAKKVSDLAAATMVPTDRRHDLTKKAIYTGTVVWIGTVGYLYMINRNWEGREAATAAARAAANEAAAKRKSVS